VVQRGQVSCDSLYAWGVSMIVEYRTGQDKPIIIGRPSRHPRDWSCVLECRYADRVEILEFTARRCRASDLQPVIADESAKLFEMYGEPDFVKFKAVTS